MWVAAAFRHEIARPETDAAGSDSVAIVTREPFATTERVAEPAPVTWIDGFDSVRFSTPL